MPKIIEVENVSKKYTIYHEETGNYSTLVESLSSQARHYLNKLRHPFTPTPDTSAKREEFWALQDINLTIEEGDRIGLIGRNGAGKSTLLKLLSRITSPTTGRIKIHGRISSLLEVGTGFHLELTGRENIFLNGSILGMSKQEIERNFDEIVAFAGIERFLDTPVKRFSSGMYMRLGFAIAASLDPDVLIVDEVLAVGDTEFQQKCLKKLNDLSRSGRTVIFVSHDISSILTLCNKGVFLEKGRIHTSGAIEQCVTEYMRTCRAEAFHWKGNEGDEHIRFHEASLNGTEEVREFFYQGEKTHLDIAFEVLQPSPDFVIGVSVWNQRNQLLGRSLTSDTPEQFQNFSSPGRHKASFQLDTNLFHEGDYQVRVECFIHNKKNVLAGEIALKLPIYQQKKLTRFNRAPGNDGIFLGNHWKMFTK